MSLFSSQESPQLHPTFQIPASLLNQIDAESNFELAILLWEKSQTLPMEVDCLDFNQHGLLVRSHKKLKESSILTASLYDARSQNFLLSYPAKVYKCNKELGKEFLISIAFLKN